MLRDNLEHVRRRVQQACRRCGRQPSSVTLIGVTKTVSSEIIRDAVALGLTELGENRVQDARAKYIALGSQLKALGTGAQGSRLPGPPRPQAGAGKAHGTGAQGSRFKVQGTYLEPSASSLERSFSKPSALSLEPPKVRWHLIGHLQSNKIKQAVELFDVIHSVDSVTLIQGLEQQVEKQARKIQTFIQVNVSGETTKSGCRPEDTEALCRALLRCSHLELKGVMTIAPFAQHAEEARPVFQQLRLLRDHLAHTFSLEPSALSLSMGMSQDFEVAIEEGADLIRVGTAIFGARA